MSGKGKVPTFQEYLSHQMLIGYGAINGVINGAIFFLLNMKKGEHDAFGLYLDFVFTAFILAAIVAPIAVAGVKGLAKKGVTLAAPIGRGDHLLVRTFPKNGLLSTLLIAAIVTLVVPALFVGFAAGLNLLPMGLIAATVLKGLMAAVAGGMTGYLAIMHAVLGSEPGVPAAAPQAA